MADSNIKLYYGYSGSEERIVPAPSVSITKQLRYANDNVIGYFYTISLDGYITPIDRSKESFVLDGFDNVISKADELREIFNKNGSNLIVKDSQDTELIKAYGSKIVSIEMQPTNNNWVNYISYNIVLEFNEIDYNGCSSNPDTSCQSVALENYAENLIDISKYKIKSFNDSWNIDLKNNIYNNLYDLPNEHFEIGYSITAEGYHHFKREDGSVLPAWEQAKNFCQAKLYDQIQNGLISNILKTYNESTACNPPPTATTDSLHSLTSDGDGILNFDENQYDVFNEQISCETSESKGSFTLQYSAIIKNVQSNSLFPNHNNVIHTINITTQTTDNNYEFNTQSVVNGTIQGLIQGGLLRDNRFLSLPRDGTLFIDGSDLNVQTKYDNAKSAYSEIHQNGDLTVNFKNLIGITYESFGVECSDFITPQANQYTAAHNYSEGNITYTATFDSKNMCMGNTHFTSITANVTDPVEQIAEFTIPGRNKAYIQKLNTYSPKTLTLNIQGYIQPDCCYDFSLYAERYCNNDESLKAILPNAQLSSAVLTNESHNINPLDGSFNIKRSYTYYDY